MNVDNKHLQKLSALNPLKSIAAIAMEWGIIVACFAIYATFKHWWLLILFIPLISTRMYALYSLLHDGMHYLLHPNKAWNDGICHVFLAGPLFYNLNVLRQIHFQHHRHLKKPDDPEMRQLSYPEFSFPLKKSALLLILFKDLTGINFLKYKVLKVWSAIKNRDIKSLLSPSLGVLVLCISLFQVFGILHLFVLLWVLPYITIYQILNRFRLYFEHNNLESNHEETRNLIFSNWLNHFISPHNLGYHREHHANPNIPFYNLNQVWPDKQQGAKESLSKLLKSLYE